MEYKSFLGDLGKNINSILSGFGAQVQSLANYNNGQTEVALSNADFQRQYLDAQAEAQKQRQQTAMIFVAAVVVIILGVAFIKR